MALEKSNTWLVAMNWWDEIRDSNSVKTTPRGLRVWFVTKLRDFIRSTYTQTLYLDNTYKTRPPCLRSDSQLKSAGNSYLRDMNVFSNSRDKISMVKTFNLHFFLMASTTLQLLNRIPTFEYLIVNLTHLVIYLVWPREIAYKECSERKLIYQWEKSVRS